MAKKLMKAQVGKIVKGAVKAVSKTTKPKSFLDFRTKDTKNFMKEAFTQFHNKEQRMAQKEADFLKKLTGKKKTGGAIKTKKK
jgi:hypothetical protein